VDADDVEKFLGKALTFSCKVRHDAGSAKNFKVRLRHPTLNNGFGTVTTLETSPDTSVSDLTTTTLSFTFAAVDVANDNGLMIEVQMDAGGALVSKNVWITEAQLEIGSAATEFEWRSFNDELFACKQYFQKSFPIGVAPAQNAGRSGCLRMNVQGATPTANRTMQVQLIPPLRGTADPAPVFYNPEDNNSNWRNVSDGNNSGASSNSVSDQSNDRLSIVNAGNAGDGEGETVAVHFSVDAEFLV
jgi:hypothetical protein